MRGRRGRSVVLAVAIRTRRHRIGHPPAVLALVLGPLLFGLAELLGLDLPQASFGREPRGSLPPLWHAAWVGGSAAYEELLFRVGILGLCFLAGTRLTRKLGGGERTARIVAELAGAVLSSLAFALDKTRIFAEERIQFDEQPIGRFQRVQDVVIDMDIALERNITWLMHLCGLYDQDRLPREQAAKVKVDSSRVASDLLVLAMEVCGGVACLDEFGLIRHHNDLFVTRVGEGSNFALKDLIVRPLRKR